MLSGPFPMLFNEYSDDVLLDLLIWRSRKVNLDPGLTEQRRVKRFV